MGALPTDLQAALADRYAIEGELGHGGMATVYRARDLKHHRAVAVKVLRPELAATLGTERFLREIAIAAQLNHPHILPLFDSGEAAGLLYYVMPLVEGESLRDRLAREKQLSVDDALAITRHVAGALSHAHRAGIIHRDIKPANILLSEGEAVVADFGIARAISTATTGQVTETGMAIGTPQYMSPEQASGAGELDGRTDIYSLGCVLYETLTGQPPFTGPTAQSVIHQHLSVPVRPARLLRPGVPAAVEQALERALSKVPADRFATASQFLEALSGERVPAARLRWRPGRRTAFLGLAAVLVGVASQFVPRRAARPALDPDLVAVAPFDVFIPELELWREGLMDILSRSLDGAGPLRTVSPTIVMRGWAGRADPASASELGTRTRARLVLFGQLLGFRGDSARLTATLFDVATGAPIMPEIELRELAANADRLADSLTVTLLRELSRTRPVGAVRSAALGSTSLPAIRAFLRAEQFYRRGLRDSAAVHYDRTLAMDSSFALAWRRLALIRELVPGVLVTYRLRAGSHNHGLPPRDSFLVLVDSVEGALRQASRGDHLQWPLLRRLFLTLDSAVDRYPEDPEIWERMGDMSYHWPGGPTPRTDQEALAAIDRAIALDSGYAPGYAHAIDLAVVLRGPAAARRYIPPQLALDPDSATAQELALIDRLLDPGRAQSAETARLLETLPPQVLGRTWFTLRHWVDSAETVLRVASAEATARHRADSTASSTPPGWLLAYHGHGREAYSKPGQVPPHDVWQLVLTGAVPHDTVTAMLGRWLGTDVWGQRWFAGAAAAWWARVGDTTSIEELARRADSVAPLLQGIGSRGYMTYAAALLRAHLPLARGDTAETLRLFASLPDTLCPYCGTEEPRTRVQLLSALRRDREAAVLLERMPHRHGANDLNVSDVFWVLERGRVHDRLGNRGQAIAAYRFVADVWRSADPALQPIVQEARGALRRLGAERD
jgi:serine/threonine-protein kinase